MQGEQENRGTVVDGGGEARLDVTRGDEWSLEQTRGREKRKNEEEGMDYNWTVKY